MRPREEIEGQIFKEYTQSRLEVEALFSIENVTLEVLLDIRDLLTKEK